MRITPVQISPTNDVQSALTPELLAACGARYSRTSEGIEAILKKVDKGNPDASVDSIFKMVDYGHASIADMVPCAVFVDGVSLWLAYLCFSLCPVVGGQETSTRYCELSECLDVENDQHRAIKRISDQSMMRFRKALEVWKNNIAPQIPADTPLLKALRMQRNFAFDRARYFIPLSTLTGFFMVQSARAWVELIQYLLSSPWIEAKELGNKLIENLSATAPRMMRHAVSTEDKQEFWKGYLEAGKKAAIPKLSDSTGAFANFQLSNAHHYVQSAISDIKRIRAKELSGKYFAKTHSLRMLSVAYGWYNLPFAEVRDLNRHRVGEKHLLLSPRGFYAPENDLLAHDAEEAQLQIKEARQMQQEGDPNFVYALPLGATFLFERRASLGQFLYEYLLRTGEGAHFHYKRAYQEAFNILSNEWDGEMLEAFKSINNG